MGSLLFIDSNNSARGQFAEAFARCKAPENTLIASAGIIREQVNPLAVQVMREIGMDISGQQAKSLEEIEDQVFDVAVALCDCSFGRCPVFPGNPAFINWNLFNDAEQEKTLEELRAARDKIKIEVDNFFDMGYFSAFVASKSDSCMILDNISDAIIAHDLERNIYYFNKAAEKLTGYKRDSVLNCDCHEAFGNPLCGDKCQFCSRKNYGELPDHDSRVMQITSRNGRRRICEMTTTLIRDRRNVPKGVLAVLRDLSIHQNLSQFAAGGEHFSGIVGASPAIMEVLNSIPDIAGSRAPVLIYGESGTGKELAARAIHQESPRRDKLFVPLNCGALPENLLESELFGHVKGAFTGAVRDKKGRFELADGGTIFLDEIGDISAAMQVKLLRVLQEGTFERVGAENTLKVDVRIISATNKDLTRELAEGRFRDDLYYRLNVIPLTLPPLRERGSDVVMLAEYLLGKAVKEAGRGKMHFSAPVVNALLSYDWPGNIRELQNWIQYAVLKCKGDLIELPHLPANSGSDLVDFNVNLETAPGKRTRKRKLDKIRVEQALAGANGNKRKAAEMLGVGRATLYRFLDGSSVSLNSGLSH
ncbi:MAG: sigma 54-interacting transcriptional regulator [Victivallaceae bacterium]|nr:sigma 54-interacting transcriptional regulator [Victivallaceae bacterium]